MCDSAELKLSFVRSMSVAGAARRNSLIPKNGHQLEIFAIGLASPHALFVANPLAIIQND
jgi:hypothetical protein